jgi:hypothetical protein
VRALAGGPLLVGLILSACGAGGPPAGPYPAACAGFGFETQQCDAVVARALADLPRVEETDIVAINLLPAEPPKEGVLLGGRPIARVEFVLADGQRPSTQVWCTGIGHPADRTCQPDAHISISTGIDGDVPCSGEPPVGCATVPPPPRPSSVDAARPLVIAELEIPLDHIGRYQVEIGVATLPDGALTVRTATLVDPQPSDYWINESIRLDVRPDLPARPPVGSLFREPFDGPEPVRVFLTFIVEEFEPGAVLRLKDVEVR